MSSAPAAAGPSDKCTPSRCEITVTVNNDDCTNAQNIKVDFDVVYVSKMHQDIQMVWILSSSTPAKYEFASADDTITFTTPPTPPTGTFYGQHVNGDGRKFWLKNENKETRETNYKYNIQLLSGGIKCARLDPSIRNGA